METVAERSGGWYLEEAREMLRRQDLLEFVGVVSKAELLAEQEPDMMARVTFLKTHGLFKFNQYKKALESLPMALHYNSGMERSRLKNYEGIMLGYQGDLHKAVQIFKEIVPELEDQEFRVETYMNLVWAYLSLYRLEKNQEVLVEAKTYLDQANAFFETLSSRMKCKIIENLTVYYFTIGEHDKAIQISESSFEYYEEADLAFVYNNLANMYLESDKDGVSELVNEYTKRAEIIGTKYKNNLEIAKSFYNKATAELRDQQLFSALDTFYLSFEFFKRAEALTLAFECLIKINEVINEYKIERLKSIKDRLYDGFKDTPLDTKLGEGVTRGCGQF